MAVPKKKISKSRRNMRRYSCAYEIDAVSITLAPTGEQVRTHTVTVAGLQSYIEARDARKAARKTSATK